MNHTTLEDSVDAFVYRFVWGFIYYAAWSAVNWKFVTIRVQDYIHSYIHDSVNNSASNSVDTYVYNLIRSYDT